MPGNNRRTSAVEIDPAYRKYLSSHYPEAIMFVKRNVETFKANNRVWLDIQGYTEFSDQAPNGAYLPGTENVILFKRIVFDVFPRRRNPKYRKGNKGEDLEYNRYITWKTATEDIESQRSSGHKGERYVVVCGLDTNMTRGKTTMVLVPEATKSVDNPAYSAYLRSREYREYEAERLVYESKLREYKAYRTSYHEFRLPDGSVKEVLLYFRTEERLDMLRSLGVPETVLKECRERLVRPVEPVPSPAPPREKTETIPAHYEERKAPGKWVWHHYVKSVRHPT